ncbi:MAG: 4Fe-4S dicluster domain-containing protein [Bacteroidota bacterium]
MNNKKNKSQLNMEAPEVTADSLEPNAGMDRRSFLRISGFSIAATLAVGCSRPADKHAVPYLQHPPEMTPGTALWFATTCAGCSAGCGALVKSRDGRPIKSEGIPDHPISRGGLCAVGQAGVLGLYDDHRLKTPLAAGGKTTWDTIDAALLKELQRIKAEDGAVRFLSRTVHGPAARAAIDRFLSSFPSARHIEYDPLSCSAIGAAHERQYSRYMIPQYRFEEASFILGIEADFLGTWISPVEYTAGYRAARSADDDTRPFARHVQMETHLSLTGCSADERMCIGAAELPAAVTRLAAVLARKRGAAETIIAPEHAMDTELEHLAEELLLHRGSALVVCGVNDVDTQLAVNAINHMLESVGSTVLHESVSRQRMGRDADVLDLIRELEEGKIAALFIHGVNPVYDLPQGEKFASLLSKVPLVVSFAGHRDETAAACRFVCPDHHPLEAWADGNPRSGVYTLSQPCIAPILDTRAMTESLAIWSGNGGTVHEQIRDVWTRTVFPNSGTNIGFEDFWRRALAQGSVVIPEQAPGTGSYHSVPLKTKVVASAGDALTLTLYAKTSMLDGSQAHNAWLQELPDPVSKIAWANYAVIAPAAAQKNGLKEGDIVRLAVEGGLAVELPVHIQPGTHPSVVAVARGYGRKGTERFAMVGPQWIGGSDGGLRSGVGVNSAGFLRAVNGCLRGTGRVTLHPTGKQFSFAATQEYDFLETPKLGSYRGEKRPLIQQASIGEYRSDKAAGSFPKTDLISMWPDKHKYSGHRWAMVIDLSACTGCSGCVVSCQAENNIPVVGSDEMRRNRELHWLRIDRYFTDESDDARASFQPMMCQQCGNAPCETVCPVLATLHSDEGLNQQVYNRCVGTRYCANNCPYKMRRFNWFDYAPLGERESLVLNPDVTVRSRGVMEKCTFCVQRIQAAKITAKTEGRSVSDGEILPACAQSCPAKAIVFGDINDPESQVAKLMTSERNYRVLEEINVLPSVGYMTQIRNTRNGADNG